MNSQNAENESYRNFETQNFTKHSGVICASASTKAGSNKTDIA